MCNLCLAAVWLFRMVCDKVRSLLLDFLPSKSWDFSDEIPSKSLKLFIFPVTTLQLF